MDYGKCCRCLRGKSIQHPCLLHLKWMTFPAVKHSCVCESHIKACPLEIRKATSQAQPPGMVAFDIVIPAQLVHSLVKSSALLLHALGPHTRGFTQIICSLARTVLCRTITENHVFIEGVVCVNSESMYPRVKPTRV